MSANAKYYVIEASSYEALRRHRLLIEQECKQLHLTPEHRKELVWALQKAINAENASKEVEENVSSSSDGSGDKDKSGDGSGDQKGGKSGSGSGSVSGDGTNGTGDGSQSDDGSHTTSEENTDTTSLLFFLASQNIDIPEDLATTSMGSSADLAVAAATLIYQDEAEIALLHEPLAAETDGRDHSLSDVLPALEEHAAELGAQILQLKVFIGAVEAFRQKHGYVPVGRSNNALQTMQKKLRLTPLFKPNGPD